MELEYINTSATLVIFKMVQSINGYICQAKQCNKYTCHIYNKLRWHFLSIRICFITNLLDVICVTKDLGLKAN